MSTNWIRREARAPQLPNILLILTDQQRADYLGCYGHPSLRTPHIDALAARGTRFERCYVASPVCMANRASIMTGRMPSAHRVRMNGIPLSLQENTFVDLLRLRGYRTALIGKSHLQNQYDIPPGVTPELPSGRSWSPPYGAGEAVRRVPGDDYDQELPKRSWTDLSHRVKTPFYGFEQAVLCTGHGDMASGQYHDWLRSKGHDPAMLQGARNALPHTIVCPQAWRTKVPEDLYPTRYIESETSNFIRRHAMSGAQHPFFVTMSFPDPHHPFTPPGKYWDMYEPSDQVLPKSFHCPDDVLPQVRWAREARRRSRESGSGYVAFAASEREAREAIALTCGMITMIDDAVGRVIAMLEQHRLLDNTVIVFSSDHGDYLGDHGLLLKGPLHLQSILRVPLIWCDPTVGSNGTVSNGLCSSIDIAATILDRAGITPYNGMQGRSLLPYTRGAAPAGTQAILIEEDAHHLTFGFKQAPRIRTLITDRHRLTLYGRSGHAELFDLRDDPDELENRWRSPDEAGVRARLLEELVMLEMEAADTSPWPIYGA